MTTANQPIIIFEPSRINQNSLFFKDLEQQNPIDTSALAELFDNKLKPVNNSKSISSSFCIMFEKNEFGVYRSYSVDTFYMATDILQIQLYYITTTDNITFQITPFKDDGALTVDLSGDIIFYKKEQPVNCVGIYFTVSQASDNNNIGELRVMKFIDKLLAVSGIEVANGNLSGSDRTLSGRLIFWKEYDGKLNFQVQLENLIKRQKDILVDAFTEFDQLVFMLCPNYDDVLTKQCFVRKDWTYALNKAETLYSMSFNLESL